jgi:predicted DNA-binding transcriptional regulator AlpA
MQDSNTTEKKAEPPTLISIGVVSAMLGVSVPTAANMAKRGDIPPPIVITPQIHRWYKHEIQEVLDKAFAARGTK